MSLDEDLSVKYIVDSAIIIGFGHHGSKRILPSLQKLEFIKKILIFDIQLQHREKYEDEKVNIEFLDNIGEAIERTNESTLVIISTTADARLNIFKQFVECGAKILYLEKPLFSLHLLL